VVVVVGFLSTIFVAESCTT
jgi:hypothetical protein